MNIPVPLLILASAFALTLTPVRAQLDHSMPGMDHGTQHAAAPTADQDMMAGMEKMDRDMGSAPMTGDADRDFVAMMIPHHQGAIDMARVELRYGKDPALRRLATDIMAAQKKEIAFMERWQANHPPR
jgi:uncharacterized protein (DUF305 family)